MRNCRGRPRCRLPGEHVVVGDHGLGVVAFEGGAARAVGTTALAVAAPAPRDPAAAAVICRSRVRALVVAAVAWLSRLWLSAPLSCPALSCPAAELSRLLSCRAAGDRFLRCRSPCVAVASLDSPLSRLPSLGARPPRGPLIATVVGWPSRATRRWPSAGAGQCLGPPAVLDRRLALPPALDPRARSVQLDVRPTWFRSRRLLAAGHVAAGALLSPSRAWPILPSREGGGRAAVAILGRTDGVDQLAFAHRAGALETECWASCFSSAGPWSPDRALAPALAVDLVGGCARHFGYVCHVFPLGTGSSGCPSSSRGPSQFGGHSWRYVLS